MQSSQTPIAQRQASTPAPETSAMPSLELSPTFRFGLASGRFVYRLRWALLVFWLAAVGASVPFALKLPSLLSGGGFQAPGSESVQVRNEIITHLDGSPSSVTVVFHSATTNVSD